MLKWNMELFTSQIVDNVNEWIDEQIKVESAFLDEKFKSKEELRAIFKIEKSSNS